jgi:hypothetical protein
MYGTTEALCAALNEQFAPDEPLALIVWTKEDVQDCLAEYHVTEIMAARIVALIDSLDGKHVCGVGEDTLVCILENLREEEAWHNQISVPAAALKSVLALAGEFMRLEEIQGERGRQHATTRMRPAHWRHFVIRWADKRRAGKPGAPLWDGGKPCRCAAVRETPRHGRGVSHHLTSCSYAGLPGCRADNAVMHPVSAVRGLPLFLAVGQLH